MKRWGALKAGLYSLSKACCLDVALTLDSALIKDEGSEFRASQNVRRRVIFIDNLNCLLASHKNLGHGVQSTMLSMMPVAVCEFFRVND